MNKNEMIKKIKETIPTFIVNNRNKKEIEIIYNNGLNLGIIKK